MTCSLGCMFCCQLDFTSTPSKDCKNPWVSLTRIPFLWGFSWLLSIISRRFGSWKGGKSKSQLKSWVEAGKGFSGFPKALETLWFSAIDWHNWWGLFGDLHQLSDKLYWTTHFSSLGWVWHLLPQLFQWCVGPQLLHLAPSPWNLWSCFSFALWGIHKMS